MSTLSRRCQFLNVSMHRFFQVKNLKSLIKNVKFLKKVHVKDALKSSPKKTNGHEVVLGKKRKNIKKKPDVCLIIVKELISMFQTHVSY